MWRQIHSQHWEVNNAPLRIKMATDHVFRKLFKSWLSSPMNKLCSTSCLDFCPAAFTFTYCRPSCQNSPCIFSHTSHIFRDGIESKGWNFCQFPVWATIHSSLHPKAYYYQRHTNLYWSSNSCIHCTNLLRHLKSKHICATRVFFSFIIFMQLRWPIESILYCIICWVSQVNKLVFNSYQRCPVLLTDWIDHGVWQHPSFLHIKI